MSKQSSTRYTGTRRAKLVRREISDNRTSDLRASHPNGEADGLRLIETLSPEEQLKAYQLADQLDVKNHEVIISFGLPAQSRLLTLTDSMLEQVKQKDIGAAGEVIADLMRKISEVRIDELGVKPRSFFQRLFHRHSSSIREVVSKYQRVSAQIDRISVSLERSMNVLSADIDRLDKLYQDNQDFFHALTIYIAAGQLKLDYLYSQMIPEHKRTAEASNDPVKIQEADDLLQFADLLDKRLYDMKISRETALQNASQIRMLQHTNEVLIGKIQSSILTTIPVWKNQLTIALTMLRQQQALAAKKQVSETTGVLADRQFEFIKNGHGLAEVELVKKTQENLVLILKETLKEIRE